MMQRFWAWLLPIGRIRLTAYWAVYWLDPLFPAVPPDAEPGAPPYGAALMYWPEEVPIHGL
jgi:hypothetical protein